MPTITTQGKAAALKALKHRRAHQPEHIDNGKLYAGSSMYYYCKSCGHSSDVLPECHIGRPRQLCTDCQSMKDLGWLE